MGSTIADLIGCAGILPASLPANDCFDLWKDVKRIAFKSKAGADPFNTVTETTFAAVKALLETEGTWTTAIGLSDIDRVMMSPAKITTFDMPQVGAEIVTEDDLTQIVPQTFPNVALTFGFTGLSSDEQVALTTLISNGLDFLPIFADGKTLFKTIDDTEADDDVPVWFRSVSLNLSSRGVQPGANTDKNQMTITTKFDELTKWTIGDTEAFGLTI